MMIHQQSKKFVTTSSLCRQDGVCVSGIAMLEGVRNLSPQFRLGLPLNVQMDSAAVVETTCDREDPTIMTFRL